MRNPILWAVAAALLFLPVAAAGQATGTVAATANVLTPLSVFGARDLDFGSVFPGVSSTILPSDVSSGQFTIAGEGNAEVDLSFTLPSTLDDGTESIPISFGPASATWATGAGGPFPFDPNTGTTQDLDAGSMLVFIGGTVDPAFDQAAGSYNSTVSLMVAYTGN